MADQLQLPVVPMTIDGSFDILPRTGKLLSWHRLKLTIHTPIYPKGKGEENLKELLTFANAAASLITTRKGALRVMPTREEVEAFIESRK